MVVLIAKNLTYMLIEEAKEYIAYAKQCGEGKKYKRQQDIATKLGLSIYAFKSRLKQARSLMDLHDKGHPVPSSIQKEPDDKFTVPYVPTEDLEFPELIEHLVKRYKKRDKAKKKSNWVEVKVDFNEPYMLVLVGDPHVDDNYFNAPKWLRDISIIQQHKPYIRSIMIGDNTNAWVGRLSRIYSDQNTTVTDAWRLVEHMMSKEGFDPLISVAGNHDMWIDRGSDPMKWMQRARNLVAGDWNVNFTLVHPNKRKVKISASHDFPGHSQWNPLHSNLKASMMGSQADIYCSGHKHNWAIMTMPINAQNRVVHLIRARGYKAYDEYATKLGHEPDTTELGESIAIVIDPNGNEHNYIHTFPDLEQGAEFLDFLRSRN
jgi:hypothetical protein